MKNLLQTFWIFSFISLSINCIGQDLVFQAYGELNQANKYKAYLNYGEAIDKYEKVIQYQLTILEPHNLFVVANYVSLGKAYLEIDDFAHAELYCRNAYEAIREKLPNSAGATNCLVCLGEKEHLEGNYDKALEYFKAAENIQLGLWGDNHMASYDLYLALTAYHIELKELDKALVYLNKIKQVTGLKEIDEVGQYYELLAEWQLAQNQLTEAVSSYQKALAIYEKGETTKYPAIARVHLALGDVYFEYQSDLENALVEYQKVNTIFENLPMLSFLTNYDTYQCNPLILSATAKQAAVYEQKYERTKEQQHLYTALFHYQQAIEKVRMSVQYFAKEPRHRQKIIHQHKKTFVGGIRVAQLLYELENKEMHIHQAFDFANAYKALSLQIAKKQEAIALEKNIPQSAMDEQEEWKNKLAEAKEAVYEAESQSQQLPSLAMRKQVLIRIKADYHEFLQDFNSEFLGVEDSVFNKQLIEFEAIPALVKDDNILLNYIVDQEHQQLYIFSFEKGKSNFTKVQIPSTFQKDIERFHRLLQSSLLPRADKKQRFVQLGNQLYQLLIQPLANQLQDKKRLVIIRDDALHLVPFEALLTNSSDGNLSQLSYLIHNFEITYHYSTGLWASSVADQWNGNDNLLGFAPVFEDEGTGNGQRSDADIWDTFRCFAQEAEKPKLAFSETEVNTINSILGNSSESKVLLFKEANEQQLKQELEQSYRFVHLASHSFANFDYPEFSGVACIDETTNSTEDGMLFINEIENLAVNADLVVLSSCESGMGQLIKGEGLLGLNRSFLYAGVPNTVFSLWKVQDKATADLMIDFYRNIKSGLDYSAALREAKLKMLKDEKLASPLFWSGFILMGR